MVIAMYEINIYEQVCRNIKKYRKEAGMTQAELAEAIGVSHEFIRRIESKKPFLFKHFGIFLKFYMLVWIN